MPLTIEQVNSASSSLSARATTIITKLEADKSFVGSWTGNNDTVESTAGAIRMIRDRQIPPWRDKGLQIVADESEDSIPQWKAAGEAFAKALDQIDGYGEDATLSAVFKATAQATVKEAGEVASTAVSSVAKIIPTSVWVAAGVIVLVVIVISMRRVA